MVYAHRNSKWILGTPPLFKRRVKLVYGIEKQSIAIDKGCADLVVKFNNLGYRTSHHCSGILSEHLLLDNYEEELNKILKQDNYIRHLVDSGRIKREFVAEVCLPSAGGYISFENYHPELEKIVGVEVTTIEANEFHGKCSSIYIKEGTDYEIQLFWDTIYNKLIDIC